MEIVWRGDRCVLVRGKQVTVLMDPPEGRLDADLVTRSARREPLGPCASVGGVRVLSGPGEYDVRGVACVGTQTPGATVFSLHLEGVSLAHLGGLTELPDAERLAAVAPVDLLIVPVGAGALGPVAAAEAVTQLEPRVVLPLPLDGDPAAVEALFRRLGAPLPNARPRLSLTAEGLPESRQVVLLAAEGRRRASGARAA